MEIKEGRTKRNRGGAASAAGRKDEWPGPARPVCSVKLVKLGEESFCVSQRGLEAKAEWREAITLRNTHNFVL